MLYDCVACWFATVIASSSSDEMDLHHACSGMPSHYEVRDALMSAVSEDNGGFGLHMVCLSIHTVHYQYILPARAINHSETRFCVFFHVFFHAIFTHILR